MSDFSLKSPDLTHYLSRILKRYPLGGQILKELLQNAEDSGASKVKFFIDRNEYPTDRLLHKGLAKFQGPSLIAYNNAQFDDADWQSIRNIEKSEKSDKPLKIGKFGLGFNSIYHITDLPAIVSGSKLAIFDPHELYFVHYKCHRGIQFDFNDKSHQQEFIEKYSDQFAPFAQFKHIGLDLKNEFKGSLFRFPIRNKEAAECSKLSSDYQELDTLIYDEILSSFFKDLRLILVFLKNLERLEIYEIANGSNEHRLLASTWIDFDESSGDLRQKRAMYKEILERTVNPRDRTMSPDAFQLDDIIVNCKMVVRTKVNGVDSCDKYLMTNYVRLKSASQELKELAIKTATLPICSLSYRLNENTAMETLTNNYKYCRYFCFLPMPETIEKSGLPFHINGSFGLRDDRRDFKWMSNDTPLDESAKWNEQMVNEVLNYTLIKMIDYAKSVIIESNGDYGQLVNFYYLLPIWENMSHNWREKHLKAFFEDLNGFDLILNKRNEWVNIRNVWLTNNIEADLKKFSDQNEIDFESIRELVLGRCFDSKILPRICIPKHLIQIFEVFNKQFILKSIDVHDICKAMKSVNDVLNDSERESILSYLIQSVDSLEMLDGIKMIPLCDKTWTQFDSKRFDEIFFFISDGELSENYQSLFEPRLKHLIFDRSKLNKLSSRKFQDLLDKYQSQIVIFSPKKHFKSLLQKSISIKNHDPNWLEKVWSFISNISPNSLNEYADLPLILHNSETFSLNYGKSNPSLIKFFILDKSNDISEWLLDFIRTKTCFRRDSSLYGCIIFDQLLLPHDLKVHKCFENYFVRLCVQTLIDVFKILSLNLASLNNDLTQYIESNLNPDGRSALIEHLNTINNQISQNPEFSAIVKDKLPIFRLYNTDRFVTAKSVDYYVLEMLESDKQESLKSIPLDPRIKLIDPSGINKMIESLKLTKYKLDDLLEKSLDYFSNDFDRVISILDWCILKLNRPNLNTKLLSKAIYRNKSGQLLGLSSIYDPRNQFVKVFVPDDLHLHPTFDKEPYYSIIAPKLAGAKEISIEQCVGFIRKISDNQTHSYDESVKQVFDYLDHECDERKRNQIIQRVLTLKWIRASNKKELFSGAELWQPDCVDLIGHVEPIIDQNMMIPMKFYDKLQIGTKSNIRTILVVRNLKHMIANSMANIKELDAIYSYLNGENSQEAKQCLIDEFRPQGIGYVYDGINQFYLPEQVLLKSDLTGLEPFYICLNDEKNSFLKRHRNLYSETFNVKASLDLPCLIDLIIKLNDDADNKKMRALNKSLLIGSIFDLIDKMYLDELTHKRELMTRLLLPVCSDHTDSDIESNEPTIEFEKIDNCVYLLETDEKSESEYNEDLICKIKSCQEKGYKIVDKRLSVKLLKRLGVASFTEKVFGLEFMESFGQHEDLVDRLHTLLSGYKDGLSIFKETIQNADDAGATVVKYCYDMRQNEKWRNPNKLLDYNMVKAQGPALFVYNDATFSDEDFTNITKLGSGSKKSHVDKIGKFGLGFNALYNMSDTPSILSRSRLIIFDPTMTYMPNRIRNQSQPGVRINFDKHKSKHLSLYSDQFKPYENIFGCNIFESELNYQGTLIRLPLRNEASRISSTLYNSKVEMGKLFEIMLKNADSILLFTQSVQRIEFYMLSENENMKLLFKLEKSLIGDCYKKHNINLGLRDAFSNQTSLLKAASSLLKKQQSLYKIETSFKIRHQIELGDVSLLSPHWSQTYSSHSSEWLLVSSFDPKYLDFQQSSNRCIPCVGMAIRCVNEDTRNNEGQAFCFLPLAIETGLNYHINATFALSEDRTRLLELSKEDKQNAKDYEYKWNEYLLEPLVENLIQMIQTMIEKTPGIENIIQRTWPLNNKIAYFSRFENKFYEIICTRSVFLFPTIDGYKSDYQSSIFIDFTFDDNTIHLLALKTLQLITVKCMPNKQLVEIPKEYLNKLRNLQYINQSNSINETSLLNLIIDYKREINLADYEKLLICYLYRGESFCKIVETKESIPTCGGFFKLPNSLLNPNSNKHFRELFETNENMFPSDTICSDSQVLSILEKLGMKSRNISSNLITNRATKIYNLFYSSYKQQANILSNHLVLYLKDSEEFELVRDSLTNIKWLFAMKKPTDWLLPWFEESHSDAIYHHNELFNDVDKNLIGCIKPFISNNYNFLLTTKAEKDLVELGIEQFKVLSEFLVKKFGSLETESIQQLDTFFQTFYIRLQKYTTENELSEIEQENRINWLKEILPKKFIYCPENKIEHKFLDLDSFAFKVEYECEPNLMKLPGIYVKDHRSRNFFERLGVKERFTLDMLNKNLLALKASNGEGKLNKESAELCFKILEEMAKDFSLKEFLANQETFYILDENDILRQIKQLYTDVTKSTISALRDLSELDLHLVNPRINAPLFNVKDIKSMVFAKIGEPFGQQEKLTKRIEDILNRYSGQFCLFKEFIQNADDAGATEIAFIVDSRQLSTKKTFGKEFNKLQGESLLCWNNATFTESDLNGIISLGIGSKQNEKAKIGRFGVGFNSVYHFTDAPQFLSANSDYVIFDPMCAHMPELETTNPGLKIKNVSRFFKQNDSALDGIYSDVESGFRVPQFDLSNSTMFRLALRHVPSDICKLTHSARKVKQLMESFIQSDDEFLVFLKNVSKVSFYEYSGIEADLKLIGEKSIGFPNAKVMLIRSNFHKQMRQIMNSTTSRNSVPISSACYSITINNKPGNIRKDLIVLEQFEFDTTTNEQRDFISQLNANPRNNQKYFPFGGIALNIAFFKDINFKNNSKLFSFLPLDQCSPIVPHINAYWSLHQENRQKIYEFSMRTENVDKETAKWCTDWNLCLINCIILPLFIRLLQFLKQNYTLFDASIFIKRYFDMFPKLENNEIRPYFEKMLKVFYTQVYDLELIPVINKNNNLQWFKPSQLMFSRDLKHFVMNEPIDCVNSIYEIIETIGIRLCRKNFLIELFKIHTNIDLAVLKPDNITDALKAYSSQIINKRLEKTPLKRIEIVILLIRYIIRNPYVIMGSLLNLQNVPLCIKQNMEVAVFSSSAQLIIHAEPELFPNHANRFLHKRLYALFSGELSLNYIRQINPEDLGMLLPSILDPNKYLNKPTYIEATESRINECKPAWKLISECIASYKNHPNHLAFIKDWSIVPVRKNSLLFLAPIKDNGIILMPVTSSIFYILREINLPVLDKLTIPEVYSDVRHVFEKIVVSLSRNEDLLHFLDKQRDHYDKILANNENRKKIFQELSKCIYTEYYKRTAIQKFKLSLSNSMCDSEIRRILKNLPIYEDIFERFETLNVYRPFYFDISILPSFIKENVFENTFSHYYTDLLDFVNHENLHIMNKGSYSSLFEYLGITEIKIDRLYEMFFNCAKKRNQPSLQKILNDHVLLAKEIPGLYESSSQLLSTLKDLPFIRIDEMYYKANECYDCLNALLEFAYPEKLLPDEYRNEEWRNHLIKLGLNITCTANDYLAVANKLASLDKIWVKDDIRICRLLLEEINKLNDSSLIAQIKNICFLPSEFKAMSHKDDVVKLLTKINEPSDRLICTSGSTLGSTYKTLVWIQKPILPRFCQNAIENKLYMNFEIDTEPTTETILSNFVAMIALLTSTKDNKVNLLNRLNKKEVEQLQTILLEYYSRFLKAIKDLNMISDIQMIMVQNRCSRELLFVEPSLLVKNMSRRDQIDGYLYKLPQKCDTYWELFKLLGSNEEISYKQCQKILEDYYNENRDQPLNDELYNNVLLVMKLLVYDGLILKANEDKDLCLYLPNMQRIMKPLGSLYYRDNIYHENLIDQSADIRKICLFDVNDLVRVVKRSINNEESSSEIDDTDPPPTKRKLTIKDRMLREISWKNIFNGTYSNEPRPLSEILSEMIVDMSSLDGSVNETRTDEISSTDFCESVLELIKFLDDSFASENEDDKESAREVIKSIKIYTELKEIQTCFRDKRTGEVIANSERHKKFVCLKENGMIKFCASKGSGESDEYHFFLSEVILEALLAKLTNLKKINVDAKIQRHFVFVVNKLLKSHYRSNYSSIVSDYKSSNFFSI